MTTPLEELLARATELEAKAADLAGVDPEPESDPADVVVDELEAKIALLEDHIETLEASSEPGVDPIADRDAAGVELFAPPPEPTLGETLGDSLGFDADFDPDELAAFADTLEAEADAEEEKAFDFDALLDDDLEVKAERSEWVRDGIGQFASDGDEGEGGKPKVADVKVDTVDDVRDLIRRWGTLPAAMKADLKKEMAAVVKGADGDHDRLAALVDGLGDGDGEKEKGEGSAAAVRRGEAGDWLEARKEKSAGVVESKDDMVPLSEIELLQARRAQL